MPTTLHASGSKTTPVTESGPWRLGNAAHLTNSAAFGTIPAKADLFQVNDADRTNRPLTDAATGRVIFEKPQGSALLLMFVAVAADNDQMDFRIWTWEQIRHPSSPSIQWHPQLLYTGTAVASGDVGIATGLLDATVRYADSIINGVDRTLGLHAQIAGPTVADDGSIILCLDALRGHLIEVEGRRGTPTPTSWNFLYAGISGM